MIVVQPPSSRIDAFETTPHEEHLLERMTMLENTLAKLAERLEEGLNLLLRQSETTYINHTLVKSLIEMLHDCGVVDSNGLETRWRAECNQLSDELAKPAPPTPKRRKRLK